MTYALEAYNQWRHCLQKVMKNKMDNKRYFYRDFRVF